MSQNKEAKPIYMCAISALLIQKLLEDKDNRHNFKNEYFKNVIIKHTKDGKEDTKAMLSEIQKSLNKAIYIHYVGANSSKSKSLTERLNSSEPLSEKERESLLIDSQNCGRSFFENAIDNIRPKFNSREERDVYEKSIEAETNFISSTTTAIYNLDSEIGQLLKVCETYT